MTDDIHAFRQTFTYSCVACAHCRILRARTDDLHDRGVIVCTNPDLGRVALRRDDGVTGKETAFKYEILPVDYAGLVCRQKLPYYREREKTSPVVMRV